MRKYFNKICMAGILTGMTLIPGCSNKQPLEVSNKPSSNKNYNNEIKEIPLRKPVIKESLESPSNIEKKVLESDDSIRPEKQPLSKNTKKRPSKTTFLSSFEKLLEILPKEYSNKSIQVKIPKIYSKFEEFLESPNCIKNNKLPSKKIPSDIEKRVSQMKPIISKYLHERSIDAISMVGFQGGYIRPPENSAKIKVMGDIAYGIYNYKKVLVSKETIEEEIASYIKATLPFSFIKLKYLEPTLKQKEPRVKVKIEDEFVNVNTNTMISISRGKKDFMIDNTYETKIPVRLGKIYNAVDRLIDKMARREQL